MEPKKLQTDQSTGACNSLFWRHSNNSLKGRGIKVQPGTSGIIHLDEQAEMAQRGCGWMYKALSACRTGPITPDPAAADKNREVADSMEKTLP
ncbi:hypothetical protein D9M68_478460 [compost metagenome]